MASYEGDHGFHCEAQQALSTQPDEDGEDDWRLGIFCQYGWAPQDRNEAAQYLGAGVAYRNPIRGRDEDSMGLGVAHLIFSDRLPDRSAETALELFYRLRILPWMVLQPDVQFIARPNGNGRDALAVGLRYEAIR